MTMANDTCPHCGASAKGPEHDWDHGCGRKTDFACGSSRVVFIARDSLSLWQSEECKDRELTSLRNQLATVTAERDELRSRFRPLPNLQRQSTPTNCFRACVAMVLGLPIGDVPEACDGASWDWDEFQRWMSGRGMQAIEVAFENGGTLYPVSSPVPCIVTGQSPRESTTGRHAVVGRFIGLAGFELVGDPHPSDLWIDGEPTHAVFFVPLWPTVISERDELRRRIDDAPVGFLMKYSTGRLGTEFHWSGHAASASAKKHGTSVARVRLVRDDQPGEES